MVCMALSIFIQSGLSYSSKDFFTSGHKRLSILGSYPLEVSKLRFCLKRKSDKVKWLGATCKILLAYEVRLHDSLAKAVIDRVLWIAQITRRSFVAMPSVFIRKPQFLEDLSNCSQRRDGVVGIANSPFLFDGRGSPKEGFGICLQAGMQLYNPLFGLLIPSSALSLVPASTIHREVLIRRLSPLNHKVFTEMFFGRNHILGKAFGKVKSIDLGSEFKKLFLYIMRSIFIACLRLFNVMFYTLVSTPEGGALSFCI